MFVICVILIKRAAFLMIYHINVLVDCMSYEKCENFVHSVEKLMHVICIKIINENMAII